MLYSQQNETKMGKFLEKYNLTKRSQEEIKREVGARLQAVVGSLVG